MGLVRLLWYADAAMHVVSVAMSWVWWLGSNPDLMSCAR